MRPTYLLIGNYGVGNLGDEILKQYFLQQFPNVDWKVVSANPTKEELQRLPCGFRSLFSSTWLQTLKAYRECDGVVFGGGTLFTDTESVYACLLWWWHAFVAHMYKKKIVLAYQGIGPFSSIIGQKCADWVLNRAAHISVRDEHSYKRVAQGNNGVHAVQTFDPAISVLQRALVSLCVSPAPRKILTVIPRHNSGKVLADASLELLHTQPWDIVYVLSMQPDNVQEQGVCNKLCNELGEKAMKKEVYSVDELLTCIQQSVFVCSERFHGALAALVCSKEYKVISQKAHDKLQSVEYKNCSYNVFLQEAQQLVEIEEERLLQIFT